MCRGTILFIENITIQEAVEMNRYTVKQDVLSGYYRVIDNEGQYVVDSYEWPADAKQSAWLLNRQWIEACKREVSEFTETMWK